LIEIRLGNLKKIKKSPHTITVKRSTAAVWQPIPAVRQFPFLQDNQKANFTD
jgi:hypothetical protein